MNMNKRKKLLWFALGMFAMVLLQAGLFMVEVDGKKWLKKPLMLDPAEEFGATKPKTPK
jgi:hypothetical protein